MNDKWFTWIKEFYHNYIIENLDFRYIWESLNVLVVVWLTSFDSLEIINKESEYLTPFDSVWIFYGFFFYSVFQFFLSLLLSTSIHQLSSVFPFTELYSFCLNSYRKFYVLQSMIRTTRDCVRSRINRSTTPNTTLRSYFSCFWTRLSSSSYLKKYVFFV